MTTEQLIKQVLGQSAQQFLFYVTHKPGCPLGGLSPERVTSIEGNCKCGLTVITDAIERQWGFKAETNTYTPADMPGTHDTVYICDECGFTNKEHKYTCSLFRGEQPVDVAQVVSENEDLVARVSTLQNTATELEQQLTDASESADQMQVDRQVREEKVDNIVNSRFGFVDVAPQ